MMEPRVIQELSQANQTPEHKRLLDHVKGLVNMSRTHMSNFYDQWDDADMIYRGERAKDEEDKKANAQKAPSKIVVPLTYAQVQTFVAFAMNLLTQREYFYELEGTGEEDHKAAKLAEALLEQNLQYNQFTQVLYQFFLDIGRFSLGVVKTSWAKETEVVWIEQELPPSPFGVFGQVGSLLGRAFNMPAPVPQKQTRQVRTKQTKYLGNDIRSISPYKFYPDTRLPLTDFQRGEFCGSEEEMTRAQLRQGEADGIYAGVSHIKDFQVSTTPRDGQRGKRFRGLTGTRPAEATHGQLKPTVIVTEIQVTIIPSEFKLSDGATLGSSTEPEKWIVSYANDDRIIRLEPLGYAHNNYTYRLGQFSPDQHGLVNESISEMVSHLQLVIDWLINSHITNVRKHISNKVVADPAGLYMEDLRDHKPVIRMKPGVANTGVDKYLKQLTVSDVTRGHIADVQVLMQFVSMTTAISDNLMGQYHTGRRSAREAANTATASGTRLRTIIKLIFDTCFLPLGRDMISNLRDGLDEETFVTVTGSSFTDWDGFNAFKIPNEERYKIGVNRTHLGKRYDFKLFDGTLPSEKASQAETLEQTLLAMMRNPEGLTILTQVLGYDPAKLFTEVLTLRGIKHPQRFLLDPVRANLIQQAQIQQQQLTQPTNGPVPAGGGPPINPSLSFQGGIPTPPPSFTALAS